MGDMLVKSESLVAVAEAIRAKSGTSDALTFPGGFVEAVGAIQAGSGGGDDELEKLITNTMETVENNSITTIDQYSFYRKTSLKNAKFPNVTNVGSNAFSGCSNLVLTNESFPKLGDSSGSECFNGCQADSLTFPEITKPVGQFTSLQAREIRLPNATTCNSRLFRYCRVLENVYVPKLTMLMSECFQQCYSLTHICVPSLMQIRTTNAIFDKADALAAFILPNNVVATLSAALTLPDATTVYVPANLYNDYIAATNWVAIADRISTIESSPEIMSWMSENGYEYEVTA